MIKKISIFFFVIVALNHCGFSPIYLEISNDDLSIEKLSMKEIKQLIIYIKHTLISLKTTKMKRI